MTRWVLLAMGLQIAALCGCRTASGAGLEGRIMKGPMCPGPTRPDRPCPNKPAIGSFLLVDAAGKTVARFQTDAEGRFKVPAPPGDLFVVPAPEEIQNYLWGIRREVTVPAEGWGRAELVFDTGMR